VIVRFEILRAKETDPVACPICESKPYGISQIFAAPATVISERKGVNLDGCGTDTQILWNNAKIVSVGNLAVLVCNDGHHFVHPKVEADTV